MVKQGQQQNYTIFYLHNNFKNYIRYRIQISSKYMQTHRSLKNILLTKYKFQEESKTDVKSTLGGIISSGSGVGILLEKIDQQLSQMDKSGTLKKEKLWQSQKQLDIIPFNLHRTLSKERPIPTTARGNPKQQTERKDQNGNVVPTKMPKYKNLANFQPSILTPAKLNVSHEDQPKRPKILNRQRQSQSFLQEFKLGKMLGKGRFGNVFRVQHLTTNFIAAVKKISIQKLSKKMIERLTWQIKIQSFVKHEHCLELYKYYREGNSLYLIIELGECSLFDKLRKRGYFTEVETCYYVTQTVKALMHLHSLGVVHRDLKPENIVLVNNMVKLADFGWAIYISNNQKRTTFCGTLDYVSPEVILGSEYDFSVDAWSVGVLCYELCTGHAPFESPKSREQTYRKILGVQLKYPRYLSSQLKDFISRLLTKQPSQRMNLTDALQHPWIHKYCMI